MGEGGVRVDVEHGKRVFAIVGAALHQDDGDEVDAGRFQKGKTAGLGEVLDVGRRDVADDVQGVVDNGYTGETLGTHE